MTEYEGLIHGIKWFVIAKLRIAKRITQHNIKLVVIDIVQEHIHTGKVVGCVVNLLPEESVFDYVVVEMFFSLLKQ